MKLRLGILTLLFAAAFAVGGFVQATFSTFGDRAKASEVRSALAAFASAEEGYYREWKRYSTDPKDFGYQTGSDHLNFEFFVTKEQMPAETRQQIPDRDLPFASSDAYQIVAVPKQADNVEFTYWILDQTKIPRKITITPKRRD